MSYPSARKIWNAKFGARMPLESISPPFLGSSTWYAYQRPATLVLRISPSGNAVQHSCGTYYSVNNSNK